MTSVIKYTHVAFSYLVLVVIHSLFEGADPVGPVRLVRESQAFMIVYDVSKVPIVTFFRRCRSCATCLSTICLVTCVSIEVAVLSRLRTAFVLHGL